MRKLITPLLILLMFVLSACGSSNESEPTATTAVEPVEEAVVVETEPAVIDVQASEAVCVAETLPEDFFEEGDWVEGAEKGYSVTIIEYGDYQ